MKTIKRYFVIGLLLLSQFFSEASAQQKTWLGISLASNYDYYKLIQPETGIFFEKQFTLHSAFETGVYYRVYQNELYVDLMGQAYYPNVNENYLTIPVSYKYYSGIVNASIGISYDYFLGWKQVSGNIELTSFRPGNYYYLGFIAKVSKEFRLDDDFAIEPEVKANILALPDLRPYYGLGIRMKFNLRRNKIQ